MSDELRAALAGALADVRGREIGPAVRRLIASYRSGLAPIVPMLDSAEAVTAYAAYRMPATYAAVREVFAQVQELRPRTMLDLGGGTGAAAWAAAAAFPSLHTVTVTDQSTHALNFGQRLAGTSSGLDTARFQPLSLDPASIVEPADLIAMAYLLGELDPPTQERVVGQVARAARIVVVVEPGTPAGYRRVLVARDALIAAGLRVLAPCPHSRGCPLAGGRDWCHFAARLDRSALHRQAKDAERGHEDEKFSYVIAARGGADDVIAARGGADEVIAARGGADDVTAARDSALEPAAGRVLRRPVTRKGLVTMTVCTRDGGVVQTPVAKSRPLYRAARKARWGSAWPPTQPPTQPPIQP